MENLVKAGLFGNGLTPVRTPALVDRYNECLKFLGLDPTTLDAFDIDGIGWSPQIAQALGDNYYLTRGSADQLAIILSPDQRHKPIYFPFTSFDRQLMCAYFDAFSSAISDITSTSGICLHIDSEMTDYESPADLLLIDYVMVRTIADDLTKGAQEQKNLVQEFGASDLAWFDPKLRQKIAESSALWGDMRFRQVEIGDWRFDGLSSFFTRAFDGVFIFRQMEGGRDIVVLENDSGKKPRIKDTDVYFVSDKNLLTRLKEEGLIEIDLEWYSRNMAILSEKRDCIIADVLSAFLPNINIAELNSAQLRGHLDDLKNELPKVFFDLERLIRQLDRGKTPEYDDLSLDLRLVLLHPSSSLDDNLREVVGRLIARLQPRSLLCTFTYDKNLFYERYESWPESKKVWAIRELLRNYKPQMHQLSEKHLAASIS
ncbi:MAG: DUF6638 family protein [Candidatus Buchananbacteria bacterium]